MKKRTLFLIFGFALLVSSLFMANALDWPTYNNDYNRTGHQSASIDIRKIDYVWNSTLFDVKAVVNGIGYGQGTISSFYYNIYAVNMTDGSQIWNYSGANQSYLFGAGISPITVSDGVVYVGTLGPEAFPDPANALHAINATTGTQIWNVSGGVSITSAPAVSDGVVYFSGNGINAVYAANGSNVWNNTGPYSIVSEISPILYNNILYTDSLISLSPSVGAVYAINASNGSEIWNYTYSEWSIQESIALENGIIYSGSGNGYLYALNATTGSQIWNYSNGGGAQSPGVYNGIVYVEEGNEVYALNATTGSLIWSYSGGGLFGFISLIVTNDRVFVGGRDGYIYSFDFAGGALQLLRIRGEAAGAGMYLRAITEDSIYFADRPESANTILYSYLMCDDDWVCTDWNNCVDGLQTRTCTDRSNCSTVTTSLQPELSQTCDEESKTSLSGDSPSQSVSVPSISSGSGGRFRIDNPKIDLRNITIFPKTNIRNASLNVQQNSSKNIIDLSLPFGTLYQAFSITTQAIENTDLNNISLEFRVNKTWLGENNYSYNDVVLYRVPDETSLWEKLSTVSVSEDDMYYYFLAISPGFSVFVIVASETAPCTPSQTRCFNNEVQLCSENSVWTAKETCAETCRNGQCVEERKMLITSAVFYTALVLMVSAAIIAVFLKLKFVAKRKRKKKRS